MSFRDSLVDALDTVANAESILANELSSVTTGQMAALRAALAVSAPLLRLMADALRTRDVSHITRIESLDFNNLEKLAEEYENQKFTRKD